jgi:hypothetical protein
MTVDRTDPSTRDCCRNKKVDRAEPVNASHGENRGPAFSLFGNKKRVNKVPEILVSPAEL